MSHEDVTLPFAADAAERRDPGVEGDLVSWQAKSEHGLKVGEVVLIDGQVKALAQGAGERITEVWYARILRRDGGQASTQG